MNTNSRKFKKIYKNILMIFLNISTGHPVLKMLQSTWSNFMNVARKKLYLFYRSNANMKKNQKNTNSEFNYEIIDTRENIPQKYEFKVMEEEIGQIISSLEDPFSTIIYLIDIKNYKYSKVIKELGLSERTIRELRNKAWKIIETKLIDLSFPEEWLKRLPTKKQKNSLVVSGANYE